MRSLASGWRTRTGGRWRRPSSAESARLAGLVDKLLDLSRLEGGHAQPRPDWCSIEEVVTAAVEDLGERAGLVRVSLDPDLPFVRADAAQLERAIANLLDNAVRFSAGEQALVRARALRDRLAIRVVDRGPGVPQGELERIFEPFYQGARRELPTTAPDSAWRSSAAWSRSTAGGSGRSRCPGQGTTFVVELPLEPLAEHPRPLPQEAG